MGAVRALAAVVTVTALSLGCYVEGNSYFLAEGEADYFLTMSQCEAEALAVRNDGSRRYAGYECRRKLLWFLLSTQEYSYGERVR